MTDSFKSVESYLHKYAKTTLASWLRKKYSGMRKCLENIEKSESVQKLPKDCAPYYNVYVEYPVGINKNADVCGIDDKSKVNNSNNYCQIWDNILGDNKTIRKDRIPTGPELTKYDIKPLFIFDIVLVENNKIKYIFEIKHKHAITQKKRKFLEKHSLEMYEIDAVSVLENVRIPWNLKYIEHLNGEDEEDGEDGEDEEEDEWIDVEIEKKQKNKRNYSRYGSNKHVRNVVKRLD